MFKIVFLYKHLNTTKKICFFLDENVYPSLYIFRNQQMYSPYCIEYLEEIISIQSNVELERKDYSPTELIILSNIAHWLNLIKARQYCFDCLLEKIKNYTLHEMIECFDMGYLHNIFHLFSFLKLIKK